MSNVREFKKEIMDAEDCFAPDGSACPKCGTGELSSDDWPDEAYIGDELRRVEYFTCTDCGWKVAVMDVYVLDRSKRKMKTGNRVFFDIQ